MQLYMIKLHFDRRRVSWLMVKLVQAVSNEYTEP